MEHHRFELRETAEGCELKFLAMLPNLSPNDPNTIQPKYSVACGWHYKLDAMEWDLEGLEFEDEGYAGPVKTELYFAYHKADKEA